MQKQWNRLADAIEREGTPLNLRIAERGFSPHLTLGRVRSPRRREALAGLLQQGSWDAPPGWTLTTVTLYQSVLSSQGPRYAVLADVPLIGR